MGVSTTEKRNRPGRPSKTPDPNSKPIVGGQVEASEKIALQAIVKQTGRTESFLVRAAVLLLMREFNAGRFDLSQSIEATFPAEA